MWNPSQTPLVTFAARLHSLQCAYIKLGTSGSAGMQDDIFYALLWAVLIVRDFYVHVLAPRQARSAAHHAGLLLLLLASCVSFTFYIFAYCIYYTGRVSADVFSLPRLADGARIETHLELTLGLVNAQQVLMSFMYVHLMTTSWPTARCAFASAGVGACACAAASAALIATNPSAGYLAARVQTWAWAAAVLQGLAAFAVALVVVGACTDFARSK